MPQLDAIVGSIAGGGMMAGICIAAKVGENVLCQCQMQNHACLASGSQALKPSIRLIGSEPKNADDCARSLAAGRIIPNASPPVTIADSLA